MEKICLQELKGVKILGRGGSGTVVLVAKEKVDRPLALKVMSKSAFYKSNADEMLRKTQTELDIVSSLHHPFLFSLLGVVETDRITGLLGEYCPGGDLDHLRHQQPHKIFSKSAIRFYAAEIVIALEHLHRQGIVHRDLKPENILIKADGHIMLTDFDLSTRLLPKHSTAPSSTQKSKHSLLTSKLYCCIKPFHSSLKHAAKHNAAKVSPTNTTSSFCLRTKSNSRVGTEEYVAPEILQGIGHEFAVDWWALGILLFELLYGKTPFKGTTKKHTFYNILTRDPQFTGPWSPLRDLITRLLEKEPSRRLGSRNGAQEIKEHSFFKSLGWDTIHRVSRPPFVPPSNNFLQQFMMNVNIGTGIDIEGSVEING
ncbi:hypothetical protein KI387_016013 [Taxus chinensis]|uniref:non-specific serine/threonine protein kinase n=1 Tax=Taxus chinensis TaxID=29808 RepID=A0AA38GGY5_TAXCH|nr:hypothetical protein KI387_016013 [Taxus chinensis]